MNNVWFPLNMTLRIYLEGKHKIDNEGYIWQNKGIYFVLLIEKEI